MDKKVQTNKDGSVELANKNTSPRPNESASFSVEAHVKIFDPATKEVYVEKRA
jgi:hypothetical protein